MGTQKKKKKNPKDIIAGERRRRRRTPSQRKASLGHTVDPDILHRTAAVV